MTNTIPPAITTPCIDVCKMDKETDLCQGCFRTRHEIKTWKSLDEPERLRLMVEIDKRRPS